MSSGWACLFLFVMALTLDQFLTAWVVALAYFLDDSLRHRCESLEARLRVLEEREPAPTAGAQNRLQPRKTDYD